MRRRRTDAERKHIQIIFMKAIKDTPRLAKGTPTLIQLRETESHPIDPIMKKTIMQNARIKKMDNEMLIRVVTMMTAHGSG